jgi:lysophospholipase L1-like esterase
MRIGLITLLCWFLMGFTEEEEKILFVGDSLTAYRGGWQHQLSRLRHAKYDNISKAGKRTKWMLNQMEKYPLGSYEYDTVIIYGGINDSFSSVKEDETIKNIQSMVYIAKKMGAVPIVIVGYNPQRVIQTTIYSAEVETKCRNRYISLQKRIQTDLKECVVIPMEDSIFRGDSSDGIHLISSGHRKFAKFIFDNL